MDSKLFSLDNYFFGNKLARRILYLLLTVAIVPVLVVSVLSFQHVSGQLREQSYKQSQQSSKAIGLEYYRRLVVIKNQLQEVRDSIVSRESEDFFSSLPLSTSQFPSISGLARTSDSGELIQTRGQLDSLPQLSRNELDSLDSGRAVLAVNESSTGTPDYFLFLRFFSEQPQSDLLVGRISPEFLFSVDELLTNDVDLIILDAYENKLYSSVPGDNHNRVSEFVTPLRNSGISGRFTWDVTGTRHLASFWSVFSDVELTTPYLVVVISQPESEILAPIARFRDNFIPAIFLTILSISLLAVNQIHKKLSPLSTLRDATRRIASGDFKTRLKISGDDEIGQLEQAFNKMAQDLGEFLDARDSAQAANKAKSDFLSSMSHELRTPLNAIIGFSQLLDIDKKADRTGSQNQYPKEIIKAGYHLLDLINEVLDLSKIEAGQLNLQFDPVSISSITSSCVKQIQVGMADEQNIAIIDRTVKNPFVVIADEQRLTQVLFNLLSNAVKYNQKNGSVVVESKKLKNDRIRITVTDSGPGIAPQHHAKLFEPFVRLSVKMGGIEGTGIGLTVAKQLMEAMGGDIGVESQLGKGASFWIDLPLATSNEIVGSTPEKQDAILALETNFDPELDYKILYVEDSQPNVLLVREALKKWGNIDFISAESAEDGLELVKIENPDLILMDICLPGMDGFTALEILRAAADTKAIPVVALSANAMDSDIKSGMNAGFDEYLTKPVDIPILLKVISKFISSAAPVA